MAASFCGILLLTFIGGTFSSKVPLILWEKELEHSRPQVLSGHSMGIDKVFNEHVKDMLERNKNVLVFLQDELSIDDFSKYTTSFTFLKRFNEIKSPLIIPDVNVNRKTMDMFIRETKKVKDVFQEDIDEWKFDGTPGVYLFHLEPLEQVNESNKKEILQRNDKLFHETMKKVEKVTSKFAIVYTAKEPSEDVSELLATELKSTEDEVLKRHLLGKHDSEKRKIAPFNNKDCVLMYFSSIKFGADKKNMTELINNGFTTSDSSCSAGANSIVINLNGTKGAVEAFTMKLVIISKESLREWYCKNITLKGKYNGKEFEQTVGCGGHYDDEYKGFPFEDFDNKKAIIVPLDMSYSCGNLFFNTTDYHVQLKNFQLQPRYNVENPLKKFSGAYDCTGFFTLPILTGIFVSAILLLGLFFGIMMMMAIQTPELFDDPKGQTISVPTQE